MRDAATLGALEPALAYRLITRALERTSGANGSILTGLELCFAAGGPARQCCAASTGSTSGCDARLLQLGGAKGHRSAGRRWHDVLVSLALLFAVVDLIVGGHLLWYLPARARSAPQAASSPARATCGATAGAANDGGRTATLSPGKALLGWISGSYIRAATSRADVQHQWDPQTVGRPASRRSVRSVR